METHYLTQNIALIGTRAAVFPDGIEAAFDALKNHFPDWEQRTLYGLSWPDKNKITYVAAITEKEEGELLKPGCEKFVLKKGEYVVEELKDWEQQMQKIGEIFQKLIHSRNDLEAPCVEWYQGKNLLCMVRTIS